MATRGDSDIWLKLQTPEGNWSGHVLDIYLRGAPGADLKDPRINLSARECLNILYGIKVKGAERSLHDQDHQDEVVCFVPRLQVFPHGDILVLHLRLSSLDRVIFYIDNILIFIDPSVIYLAALKEHIRTKKKKNPTRVTRKPFPIQASSQLTADEPERQRFPAGHRHVNVAEHKRKR